MVAPPPSQEKKQQQQQQHKERPPSQSNKEEGVEPEPTMPTEEATPAPKKEATSLLDELFRKTKATPCIYWLPLSEAEVSLQGSAVPVMLRDGISSLPLTLPITGSHEGVQGAGSGGGAGAA